MTTYAIYTPDGKADTYYDGKKWEVMTFHSYDEALEFLNSDAYDTTEGYTVGIYIIRTRGEASQ